MATRPAKSRHRKNPEPLSALLGARIKGLRAERGFTFDAFVGESELGRGYVSQMERGLVVPTYTTLLRIARTLELTVSELLALGASPVERFANAARDLKPVDLERLVRAAERLAEKRRADIEGRQRSREPVAPRAPARKKR